MQHQHITYDPDTGAITGVYTIHAQQHEIDDVVAKLTCHYIIPDKLVMNADCHNLKVDCETKQLTPTEGTVSSIVPKAAKPAK